MDLNALQASMNQQVQDSFKMQQFSLKTQTQMNNNSAWFNTAMANKDAEKKAFEKIHG